MDTTTTVLYSFEQNMRLINLAFECVFLYSSEKEKAIQHLEEKEKENQNINIIDFFKQENFVSKNRIEYLLAFDEHLQLRYKDQQFGRLAIANGLASKKNIANAIDYQKKYFKKHRINKKLGDILVDNKTITITDQISILLTQNRIKNKNLLDALHHIGETQAQKEAVNKRFGVLAIKNKLASIEQVNAALEIQKTEKEKGEPRFIGQILQETAALSDNEILQILLEQKQFVRRKLDLEKALYPVKTEIKISIKLNKLFEYSISKDGLEAFVKKLVKTDEAIPVYEFFIWLRRAGIKFGVVDDAMLETFLHKAKKDSQIIVATGYPAKQCIDEEIQFNFENEYSPALQKQENKDPDLLEPSQKKKLEKAENPGEKQSRELEIDEKEVDELEAGEKKDLDDLKRGQEEVSLHGEDDTKRNDIDEKKNNTPLFFKKGSLLAKIIPGKKGKPGKDVLGYPIQPGNPSLCVLNAGSGVIKKGPLFITQVDGRPVLKNETTIMVEPIGKKIKIKTIDGTICNDTEGTYEYANIELKGALDSEAVLRCHSLILHGYLKGCAICTADMDIKGVIGTDDNLNNPKDITQASIISQGSITTAKSIINSTIQTAGELLAFKSTVIGSEIIACKGMTIGNALKGEHAHSVLRFGLKPGDKLIALDRTIEKKNAELSVLRKEEEIASLKESYSKDPKIEKNKNEKSNSDEIQFQLETRLAAFEQEISENENKIKKIENENKGLQSLREKLRGQHMNFLSQSRSAIKIKNACEKGTIIKGIIARLVVEKTIYNVKFKEILDPKTNAASILIDNF